MNLEAYYQKWTRTAGESFADMLVSNYSVEQLSLMNDADEQSDIIAYSLHPEEWRDAVDAALSALYND